MRHILLSVLALAALTVSCVDPLEPVLSVNSNISGDALVFSPKVLGITPATKTTLGETDRGENTVTRIDVFVYKTTGGTSTFHKHYTIGDGTQAIQTSVDYLLESNWRTEYTVNDTYRVYAIANINANKLNDPVLPASPTEAQLKVLTSESDATIAGQSGYTCYDIVRLKNPDGTSPAAQSLDHHIGSKLFLMDGKVDGWRIKDGAAKQYITTTPDQSVLNFNLSRAAAKFRVELNFSETFKESLGTADTDGLKFTTVTEYWPVEEGSTEEPKPKTVRIITIGSIAPNADGKIYADGTVTGGARAKFANILKATYNVAPEGKTDSSVPTATQQNTFRDENLWDSQNFYEFSSRTLRNPADPNGGYKYPYVDTTYSYAFGWDADQAAEKAPALAVSIVYTTYVQKYTETGEFDGEAVSDGGVTNYYRIPLIDITKTGDDAITSIERNYYYQVKAEINTMGTSTTEIEPTKVNLKYKVIPWPDAPDEVTEAQTVQLLYFVPEKEYRLRGDGLQTTNLQYFTPKSNPIGNDRYEATPVIRNIRVYYYDQNGDERVLQTAAGGGYTWTGNNSAGVTIEVYANPNGGGRFYVASTALTSRAVKYIEFDAVVDFSYAEGGTVTQHIIVTHFPLDNIQSISGSWSSRWDGQPSSGERTVYYRKIFYQRTETSQGINQSTWASGIGSDNTNRMTAQTPATAVNGYYATGGNNTDVNIRARDLRGNNYNRYGIVDITGYSWTNNNNRTVTVSGTRRNNNQGTQTTNWTSNIGSNNNYYDYVVTSQVNNSGQNDNSATITLHKYQSYYRIEVTETSSYTPTGSDYKWEWEECTLAQYNATAVENRKTETVQNDPSTGNWVVRGGGGGTTNSDYGGGRQGAENGQYYAKLYTGSAIHRMNQNGGDSGTANSGGNNPHMYIIQISKAENNVDLGRPRLDSNYQSDDHVVSPAFMIASQLGTIQTTFLMNGNETQSGLDAARHCGTYMEVADNGRRFVGWRLPTDKEIAYIIKYQDEPDVISAGVFAEVLAAEYYFTLDGTRARTTARNNLSMVRCVRDLTPEEVIELNSTGTITRATY